MTEADAKRIARDDLRIQDGQGVMIQSNGQASTPHYHNNEDEAKRGRKHVDGWYVWNENGNIKAEKQHGY